ncbi:hypothetical protein COCON_G00178680 [Conger conger]|uniref:DH domain-containing protein n=1 Tax=Conger conger TaxID=82655 RepID=A0A9Q1D569_CONCO|nr:hypothetical protein COCON_G00178680 [Conger conger]
MSPYMFPDSSPVARVRGNLVKCKRLVHLLYKRTEEKKEPLYQDYWLQCMREELSRKRSVPKVFAPLGLSGLLTTPHHAPADSLNLSLWQDLPEVRERGLLDVQEAMFEMIGSEASYLKSLMVAVSHFLGSQELQLILAKMEHHILFSNLTEVKRVSERRENREFVEVLRKLEGQRQNIKSFLVLPFQRIARLRIILEIDSGVQCMKPTEELVHLDKLVDFGSVKVPLALPCLLQMRPAGNVVGRFSVLDYSAFPAHVEVGLLKTEILGLPSESFLLRLSQNHAGAPTTLILTADTSSDREGWIANGTNTQHLTAFLEDNKPMSLEDL